MSDKPSKGTATAAEVQIIRKWLRDNGMSNKDAQDLVKERVRDVNRHAINEWLRSKGGNK